MKSFFKAFSVGVIAIASLGLFCAGANAQPSGLEYDEIRWVSAEQASHPPGTFPTDLDAIKTALLNGDLATPESRTRMAALIKDAQDPVRRLAMLAVGQIPYAGTLAILIANNVERAKLNSGVGNYAEAQAKAFRIEHELGKWYHVTYHNGWTRQEDVANQKVLIVKPDQDKRIYLDLALKTYDTSSLSAPTRNEASTRALLCSPSTTVNRGSKELDGVATDILETTFAANNQTLIWTTYESIYAAPLIARTRRIPDRRCLPSTLRCTR